MRRSSPLSTSSSITRFTQRNRFSHYTYGNNSFRVFGDVSDDIDEDTIEGDQKQKKVNFMDILKLNKKEWPYILSKFAL